MLGTATTTEFDGSSIHAFLDPGDLMDGLEVIFLLSTVVWLYALIEYF